jgi:flagella synthesis protein FlgN
MHATPLLHLFNDDIGTAQQLLQLIDAEFQALTDRDLPLLEGIVRSKQPLSDLLAQHGNERRQLLDSLQLSADRAGLQALASRSEHGDELLERGDQLAELLEQCQAANLRNGRLIRANQTSVGSLLSILRGVENPGAGLYDSRGGSAKSAQQRPFSQA